MKIIYVASPPLYSKGASAIHIFKMCNAYAKLGHEVTLYIPPYNSNKNIFDFYNVKENFKIKSILSTKDFLRQIVHGISCAFYILFKGVKADIFITRNIIFAFLATMVLRIPVIYDAHHPPVNYLAEKMSETFLRSNNLIRLTTNSNGLARMYEDFGIPRNKIAVAHNGVDLDNLKYLSKSEARKVTKLPAKNKIVLYSGNIYKGRGIDILLDVASSMPKALFIVVGGEESDIDYYKKMLEDKKINNFNFKGFVKQSEVYNYLLSADVLVMPYTKGMTIKSGTVASDFTSPIKLFEYMASKRVIVASAIPSVEEILKDRINSILVKPGSRKSLYNGIKTALEDKENSKYLANKAYKGVKNYSWDERARKVLHNL